MVVLAVLLGACAGKPCLSLVSHYGSIPSFETSGDADLDDALLYAVRCPS